MKVIVFDMDDTLYDEYEYVKSGFRAVSKFLAPILAISEAELFTFMWLELEDKGRGQIFDHLLKHYGYYTKTLARKCVFVYRMHEPNIALPNETIVILNKLKVYPLYLVTDGHKMVQYNKIKALGLEQWMRHCFITHRYGKKHAKPSPYCFQLIQKREKVPPHEIVYIGDNPRKDFVGIKPLGFRTLRVMTGEYRQLKMPEAYEAELQIYSLRELPDALTCLWPDFTLEDVKQ